MESLFIYKVFLIGKVKANTGKPLAHYFSVLWYFHPAESVVLFSFSWKKSDSLLPYFRAGVQIGALIQLPHLRRKWKRKKVHVFRCQKGYIFLKRELFSSITWCTSCTHRCRSSGESNWILLNSDVSIDSLDALHLHWLPLNSIDEDRNHHHPLDMNLGKASDSNVNKHLLKNPTFPPVASLISMWYEIWIIHLQAHLSELIDNYGTTDESSFCKGGG